MPLKEIIQGVVDELWTTALHVGPQEAQKS